MKFFFHQDAEAEFLYAVQYYEECEDGLGYEFAVEVYVAIERILTHPHAWQYMEEGIRLIDTKVPLWDIVRGRK